MSARLLCALLAGSAAFTLCGSAAAQGENILQECLQRIANLSQQSVDAIDARCQDCVTRIANLDAAGAPDAAIVRAGRHCLEHLRHFNRRSDHALDDTTRSCLRMLRRAGAPPDAAQQVLLASRAAHEAVNQATLTCAQSVRQAVDDATEDPAEPTQTATENADDAPKSGKKNRRGLPAAVDPES